MRPERVRDQGSDSAEPKSPVAPVRALSYKAASVRNHRTLPAKRARKNLGLYETRDALHPLSEYVPLDEVQFVVRIR